MDYQIILILKGVVQGGDPLAISIHQHVTFFPKTSRLQKKKINLRCKFQYEKHIKKKKTIFNSMP